MTEITFPEISDDFRAALKQSKLLPPMDEVTAQITVEQMISELMRKGVRFVRVPHLVTPGARLWSHNE